MSAEPGFIISDPIFAASLSGEAPNANIAAEAAAMPGNAVFIFKATLLRQTVGCKADILDATAPAFALDYVVALEA